jgi:hypothetical protein
LDSIATNSVNGAHTGFSRKYGKMGNSRYAVSEPDTSRNDTNSQRRYTNVAALYYCHICNPEL